MEIIIYLVIGLVVGGVVAWFIASSHEHSRSMSKMANMQADFLRQLTEEEGESKYAEAQVSELRQQLSQKEEELQKIRAELDLERGSKIEATTRLDAARHNIEEEKQLIEKMKRDLTDTFQALSSTVLKNSSEDFLRLASEQFGGILESTKGKLGEHKAAMEGMIKPLEEVLKRYEEQLKQMDQGRIKTFGSLEEQLRMLVTINENLKKETGNLVTALRKPQVRGRWGEMQLKRVAELSGMSPYCDFTEQSSLDTEKGRIRPDMIVHLPSDREIVVDAKAPLEAYLDAVSTANEEENKRNMERHAQQIRTHMRSLSSKEYWNQFDKSPEFVILFIPGESFLSAALNLDPTLIEDGIQRKVIIATPTTFIALLRAIAYGWQQERITRNAQEISALGKELYERVGTMVSHFEDIGSSIKRANESYNKTVGSLELRVLPSLRRFKDLGVTTTTDIPILDNIDNVPRNIEGFSAESREDIPSREDKS